MSSADPQPVLDATTRRLEAVVREEQARGRLPSVIAGVMRAGRLVWWSSAGSVVRRDSDLGPTPHTQYRIGSITKTMTALLVMQLRDEGVLSLSDRLDQHLTGSSYGDRTLLQLISHSSGMSAEPPGAWWERSAGRTWDELVGSLEDQHVALHPDTQFHYSNVAYALLGKLIETKRGASWADVLADRLLGPLGMRRTSYLPESPAAEGFSVHPYARTLTSEPSYDAGAMAPAGQIWSTVEDLAKYAAFLADPDASVIAPETLDQMTVVHTGKPGDALAGAYGLGFRLAVDRGRTFVGHTGSMPGFLAGLFVDRAHKTAAVAVANGYAGLRAQGLPLELLRVLDECEPTMPQPWIPNVSVDPLVLDVLGIWYFGNDAFAFSYDGKGLVSQGIGESEPWCRYRPDGVDRFIGTSGYHLGETLNVVRRLDGTVSHLECATFIFTRTPYDPEEPIPGR